MDVSAKDLSMGIRNIRLLCLIDEINNPVITLKTIGHQWYWIYEYSDFLRVEFESYIIPQNEIDMNSFRLLDVDNRSAQPINTFIIIIFSDKTCSIFNWEVWVEWNFINVSIKPYWIIRPSLM